MADLPFFISAKQRTKWICLHVHLAVMHRQLAEGSCT